MAERALHTKCKYIHTLKPSGLTTIWLLEVSVLKMELMNLIIFLRGFILAFSYGKKNIFMQVFSCFQYSKFDELTMKYKDILL